ncbi:MAG: type II toxin-antitoxin system VapC family toxin [Acidobacteria bacterium]|nr:type II toxin-antitoxin system VapC family toxin [Acidobacteriota bacterium]
MIYLDTSVALAHLLAEDRRPDPSLWDEDLVSSRLLEYELWGRINARGLADSHGSLIPSLLERVSLLEMVPEVLGRAVEPFPVAVRTLDALHLASVAFLAGRGVTVRVATFDLRMREALDRMGFAVWEG